MVAARATPPYRCAVRIAWALLAVAILGGAGSAAEPEGTPAAREAREACERAREVADADGLDRAIRLAEAAIEATPEDPIAHFALFCALGERMRLRGASPRNLFALRRLRTAVDRTLELAPEFPDALVGKANLLLDAPRILGGDPAKAVPLLRRALEIDPGYLSARRDLARALARRGDAAGARAEAERALAEARRDGDAEDVAEARRVLESLEE